jgi:hypothetical protein
MRTSQPLLSQSCSTELQHYCVLLTRAVVSSALWQAQAWKE